MKLKRNERIGVLTYILTNNPNKIFTYNYFTDKLNAAKSTISEDIVIVKEIIESMDFGSILTIPGASGGVKYIPKMNSEEENIFLEKLSEKFSNPERIIVGKFVFMTDIIYSPEFINKIGSIFASRFKEEKIDYVVTIETKGIPMAAMTARCLNVPLAVIRKEIKITEGATVNVNYLSKSSGNIQNLSLSKKSMKENSRVLVIDDFMRGGGTIEGIKSMMKEFNSEVIGIGILISNCNEELKKENKVKSLLELVEIDEEKNILKIVPSKEKREKTC